MSHYQYLSDCEVHMPPEPAVFIWCNDVCQLGRLLQVTVHSEGIKQDGGMVSYVVYCAPESVTHLVAIYTKRLTTATRRTQIPRNMMDCSRSYNVALLSSKYTKPACVPFFKLSSTVVHSGSDVLPVFFLIANIRECL